MDAVLQAGRVPYGGSGAEIYRIEEHHGTHGQVSWYQRLLHMWSIEGVMISGLNLLRS